jgi:hypothetical protein
MKIDFHIDNEAKAATVKTYLFTDYLAVIMEGQTHEYNGELYRVNSLENDDNGKLKNAFVWKFPASITAKNTDARSYEETI